MGLKALLLNRALTIADLVSAGADLGGETDGLGVDFESLGSGFPFFRITR